MPGKRRQTAIGKKFDRCVRKVSRRGEVDDPKAVCAKALNRRYPGALSRASAASRRRNPAGPQRFRDCVDRYDGLGDAATSCARPNPRRPRRNPVAELVSVARPAPRHYVVDYVDADDARRVGGQNMAPGYRMTVKPPNAAGDAPLLFERVVWRGSGARWTLALVDAGASARGTVHYPDRALELSEAQYRRLHGDDARRLEFFFKWFMGELEEHGELRRAR